MKRLAPSEFAAASSMQALLALLERMGVDPGWAKREPSLYPSPKQSFEPAHWTYALGKAALDAAGRHVSTELAERRNLILFNPVEGNRYATSKTLIAAYQMVLPGEVARSHRHSPNALRLVLDAEPGAFTVVEGRKIPMVPGDVLLTPNWHWHGHSNESEAPAYWIDVLDVPMVHFFEPMFFESHHDGVERTDIVDAESPMRFPIEETHARLDRAEERHPGERVIELGPPRIDTMQLFISRMAPQTHVHKPRTTASSVYAVIDGHGRANIEGTAFEWRRGDIFVVPAWRRAEIDSFESSHLFRVTDAPVLARFNWLREE